AAWQGRAEPGTAAALHRQRRLLARGNPRTRALLQDAHPRLPGMAAEARLRRLDRADRAAAVFGSAAEVPPRRAGARCVPAAGGASRARGDVFRPAADLVRALRIRAERWARPAGWRRG